MNKAFLLLFCSLISISISAQKTVKLYQKIQTAFDRKEYFDVLTLTDKLPKEEKTTAQYYKYLCLSFDSLRRYQDAIKYYTLYTEQVKDTVFEARLSYLKEAEEKRIAAVKAKFERIKDCPKCHGTDSVPVEAVCPKCEGVKIIKKACSTCHGKGRVSCSACGGSGVVGGGKEASTCNKCSGIGTTPCLSQCDYGYVTQDCPYCTGLGYVTIQVKCDKHD